MKDWTLSKILLWKTLGSKTLPSRSKNSPSRAQGFTLIELIVVILIIAVLSAIIAPGWLAFVNRQRVAKVNDGVFSAMQEAQREAKRTKRSYSVSFKTDSNNLKVAVYPEGTTTIPWKPLNEGLDIKAGQVILCSNINTTANTIVSPATCDLSSDAKKRTIQFDYQGNLAKVAGNAPDTSIGVTVAIPQSNGGTQPIEATARCVIVKTLIGSMAIEKDSTCPLP
ncbi:Prokaryotic N-terminal methylation motif domain protein [Coleofasciculus chthonoplastes PCC 7420]|uniref:Prokaryotic N-terminal methylation motif domain protein n=1 Tax=Coleofasciculus chthonoplastes PCC 7420 TaxID=118168 RepID=B4VMI8_9CYAN|nr:prepilin-type N-terminal cleavage/methylation domain-containing protein [Coleofasciculus chthonoplastes]EDX76669.1 Prokaryotic N-terminal methylation motif domain protein [Coleofasciculus chthonoplastes PCC 7420]